MIWLIRLVFKSFCAFLVLTIALIWLGNQRPYPPLVYIAKSLPHDEVRLLDTNTGYFLEITRDDSFGALDVAPTGEILVTTHAQIGSILNTVALFSPSLIEKVHGIDDNPIWSPAADRIVYRRYYYQGGLYVYTLGDWPPRPLNIRATAITWSPDGQYLAYSRWSDTTNQEELRLIDMATRRDTFLAGWRKPVRQMRWSPDGEAIAMTTIAGDLYLFDVEAKQFTQHLLDAGNIRSVQWTNDGRLLGVITTRRRHATLTILQPDGIIQTEITVPHLSQTSSFDWWSN